MLFSDDILWIMAQERHQAFLKEAEARRLRRLLQENNPTQPRIRQRLTWWVGGLMIRWGQHLQPRQEQKWV